MKSIQLTMSKNYVKDWGLWEAVRELLQNAYDQCDRDSSCRIIFEYWPLKEMVQIQTTTGRLEVKSLLLGETDKEGTGLRGQFGEGYKLAMLTLLRLEHKVEILNNNEQWTPVFEHSEDFGTEVLTIKIADVEADSGVKFLIYGVDENMWNKLDSNICRDPAPNAILENREQKGRVYVGGLYVTAIDNLKFGYTFKQTTIKLDRDRGMVDTSDVVTQSTLLWGNREGSTVLSLLQAEAPDLDHAAYVSSFPSEKVYRAYTDKYGSDNVPVADEQDIKRAQSAGIKWTLVPKELCKILYRIGKWLIPNKASPLENLREFKERYNHFLPEKATRELNMILIQLGDTSSVKEVQND